MERDSISAGQEGERGIPPELLEALAGRDPEALQVIAEVIVLNREYPQWALWLPHSGPPVDRGSPGIGAGSPARSCR